MKQGKNKSSAFAVEGGGTFTSKSCFAISGKGGVHPNTRFYWILQL